MSEFKAWMQAMGFNGKQVARAGEMIGMGRSTALMVYRDERRLTKTERLAMAAAAAQLPDWHPANHASARTVGKIISAVAELSKGS